MINQYVRLLLLLDVGIQVLRIQGRWAMPKPSAWNQAQRCTVLQALTDLTLALAISIHIAYHERWRACVHAEHMLVRILLHA